MTPRGLRDLKQAVNNTDNCFICAIIQQNMFLVRLTDTLCWDWEGKGGSNRFTVLGGKGWE